MSPPILADNNLIMDLQLRIKIKETRVTSVRDALKWLPKRKVFLLF